MIDTIYVAQSGLNGYQRGLRVIANNTANLNTPGFKKSSLLFADMYFSTGGSPGGAGLDSSLGGMTTLGTALSFQQGQFQNTGNALDLAVDGLGLFVLRDQQGRLRYTRDGQFKLDAEGILVTTNLEEQVMAFDANGALVPVTIAALRTNAVAPTAEVTFGGMLSTAVTQFTVNGITVIDQAGVSHTLSAELQRVANTPGAWDVTVVSDNVPIGISHRITFANGHPVPGQDRFTFTFTAEGLDPQEITFNFHDATSFQSGPDSSLAMSRQDGHVAGTLEGTAFDETGTLVLSYSNGEKVRNVRLALARFDSVDAVRALGNNRFEALDGRAWITGTAGSNGFGNVKSTMVEMSNVDLSTEFSELVIMQRGYQASSQVLSTANEMLSELFGMKAK